MLEKYYLKIKNLTKTFPVRERIFQRKVSDVKALEDISLEVQRGEVLGLVGESGSGKTTLGKIILGLMSFDSGEIFIKNQNLKSIPRKDLASRMQIVFQDPFNSLDPRMKIEDIILEGLNIRNVSPMHKERKLRQLMDMVGLPLRYRTRLPHEFSGGQRQRIAIARALALDPEFLVLDEPVSSLDVSIQAQILNLFSELRQRMDLTYLFISHDLRVVYWLCDRMAFIRKGKVLQVSATEKLKEESKDPYVLKLIENMQ